MEFKYVPVRRDDVCQIYFKKTADRDLGFDIRIPYIREKNEDRILVIRCDGKTARVKLNAQIIERQNSSAHKKKHKAEKHDECADPSVRCRFLER